MVLGPENLDGIQQDVSEKKAAEKQKGLLPHGFFSDILTTLGSAGLLILIGIIFIFIMYNLRY